jgi:hypothetical protein
MNRYHSNCWGNPQQNKQFTGHNRYCQLAAQTVKPAQQPKRCQTAHNRDECAGDPWCADVPTPWLTVPLKHCAAPAAAVKSCSCLPEVLFLLRCCVLGLQHIKLLAHHHLIKVPAAVAAAAAAAAKQPQQQAGIGVGGRFSFRGRPGINSA